MEDRPAARTLKPASVVEIPAARTLKPSSVDDRPAPVPRKVLRVADTPADKQIDDFTGSGPFVFAEDEWRPGEKVVYLKFARYKPRAEPPSPAAGGKVVTVEGPVLTYGKRARGYDNPGFIASA